MSNILIILDTDDGFEARFKRKLEEEDIADKFSVVRIAPDTTLASEELVIKCVDSARNIVSSSIVSAFFVDIVIYERGALDTVGLDLAKRLSITFPSIPVFSITSKLTHEETYDPYFDVFSEATLEGFDGVFAKSYLEGKHFSAKRLRKIFEKSSARRHAVIPISMPTLHAALDPRANTAYQAFGGDTIDSFTLQNIENLGAYRFWILLGSLLPHAEGTLRTVAPGRSGAFVFKTSVKFTQADRSRTRPKSWLIKLSVDKDLMFQEAANHAEMVKTPIPRSAIPRLLFSEPKGMLGLWGIVYEFENDAETLLHSAGAISSIDAANRIADGTIRVLKSMYGDPLMKCVKLWKTYYELSSGARMSILSVIAEHIGVLSSSVECVESVANFVKGHETSFLETTTEADTRHVHGDLNCGNILVSNDSDVIFIDFASRRQDHVARDFAKLERDLLFRVLDCDTPRYYSWEPIPLLDQLSSTTKDDFLMTGVNVDTLRPNEKIVFSMIRKFRMGIVEISPLTSVKDYLSAVLYYTLLGIAHPAISLNRKALCVMHASNLLLKLNQ